MDNAYDVITEHQHIRRLVDMVESALQKSRSGDGEWVDALRPILVELSSGLPAHFGGEEVELFGDITRRLPRHVSTIQTLVEQHRRLSSAFEQYASRVDKLKFEPPDVVDEYVAALLTTLGLLRSHEEQENELMIAAFWQDLGESMD